MTAKAIRFPGARLQAPPASLVAALRELGDDEMADRLIAMYSLDRRLRRTLATCNGTEGR